MDKRIYECVQKGYDGITDSTDHLILWIAADNLVDVEKHLQENNIEVQGIYHLEDLTTEDLGIDVVI